MQAASSGLLPMSKKCRRAAGARSSVVGGVLGVQHLHLHSSNLRPHLVPSAANFVFARSIPNDIHLAVNTSHIHLNHPTFTCQRNMGE